MIRAVRSASALRRRSGCSFFRPAAIPRARRIALLRAEQSPSRRITVAGAPAAAAATQRTAFRRCLAARERMGRLHLRAEPLSGLAARALVDELPARAVTLITPLLNGRLAWCRAADDAVAATRALGRIPAAADDPCAASLTAQRQSRLAAAVTVRERLLQSAAPAGN
jgi:hypothetical protein